MRVAVRYTVPVFTALVAGLGFGWYLFQPVSIGSYCHEDGERIVLEVSPRLGSGSWERPALNPYADFPPVPVDVWVGICTDDADPGDGEPG